MKKVMFALLVAGMTLGLVSCKKDYTCTCTYDYITGSDTTISYLYDGVKKADAEEGCTATETAFKIVDPSATCSLQ